MRTHRGTTLFLPYALFFVHPFDSAVNNLWQEGSDITKTRHLIIHGSAAVSLTIHQCDTMPVPGKE